MSPGNSRAAVVRFPGPEGQLVDSGKIEQQPHIVIATGFVARSAEGILRRIRFTSADTAVIDGVRPHKVGREQKSALKGPASIQLQSFESAVAHVSAPGDRTKGRIRRDARRRIHQVSVSCGQNIGAFIAQVSCGSENVKGQLLLNGCSPGGDVIVFAVAIQVARRDHSQTAVFRVDQDTASKEKKAPGMRYC